MISLAYLSADRREPFTATASYREVADLCRCSKLRAKRNCRALEALGHLGIQSFQGRGKKSIFLLRVRYPKKEPKNVVRFRSYEAIKGGENGNKKGCDTAPY